MKIVLFAVILLLLIILNVFFYTWYRLRQYLHVHVLPDEEKNKKYGALKFSQRFFTSPDGVKIAAWYLPVSKPKAFVILVHGYVSAFGGKSLMLGHAQYLRDAGYSTLLLDMRSNGETPGNHITLGVKEWQDVIGAYDYLKTLPETKQKKIGYLGISMGAAASLIAAGITGKADFIVASVPYASYKELFMVRLKGQKLNPMIFLPALRLAALFELGFNYEQYDPLKWIGKIHVPILFFSAKQDTSVPSEDAKRLYDKANQPKMYWQADTVHNIFNEKPEEFEKRVLEFLEKYGK